MFKITERNKMNERKRAKGKKERNKFAANKQLREKKFIILIIELILLVSFHFNKQTNIIYSTFVYRNGKQMGLKDIIY